MPKIHIKYNKYLDDITKAYCATIPRYAKSASLPTDENAVHEKIKLIKEEWLPIEEKVFNAISHKAKRPFPYSIVNINMVHVVHRTEAFSMIFPYKDSVDGFIRYLIHELIHLSFYRETKEYKEKFKDESVSTRQHIIIHAMLEYIYREVIDHPEYVELDKQKCEKHSTDDYRKAWEYVETLGYHAILNSYIL